MAQVFHTPISDLNEMRLWEINELVQLANDQNRERERAHKQATRKARR